MKNILLNALVNRASPGFLAVALVAWIAVTMFSGTANAVTANGTIPVSATFVSSCTIGGASINFGNSIDPIAATTPINVTGATQVKCSNTTPFEVTVGAGLNSSGTNSRRLKNGTSYLTYQLYTDTANSIIAGQTGGGSWGNSIFGTGTGAALSINVFGQLPDLTGAVPGAYTDTVVLSVNF